MVEHLIRRTAYALFIVWASVSCVFFLMYAVGDPASATLGERASAEQLASFRAQHGLDRPVLSQYLTYIGVQPCHVRAGYCGLLQGHLGDSLRLDATIASVFVERIPRTALLGAMATTVEVFVGVGLGLWAGATRRRWVDSSLLTFAYLGISIPTFVAGLIALDQLAFRLGLFPVGGYGETPLEHIKHALLPSLVLGLLGSATYLRLVRSETRDLLADEFSRMLRSLGVSQRRLTLRYLPRLAVLPVITLLGLQLPALVGGAVITETIFGWPGLGRLAVEAVYNLDAPLVLAIVLVASVAVQAGNLLADIALQLLDPRVLRS